MKTLAKVVGVLAAAVILLLVAAVILIPMLFDPNDHKDRIAAMVKEHTGRDLKIAGDIELTVFPWLGVALGVVELGNAPGFSAPTFARTEAVSVRLKLVPLLSRRVEMDTVTVHGLTLNLERKGDGTTNLDDLTGAGEGGKPAPSPAGRDAGRAGLAGLAIGGLDVRDASVSWTDGRTGQAYRVSGLRAQTGALAPGKPVDVELAFDVTGGAPAVTGHVALSGVLAADVERQIHELTGLELALSMKGEHLPNQAVEVRMAGDVSADLGKQTAELRNLKATYAELALSGRLAVTQLLSTPAYQGSFEIAPFNLRSLMGSLGLPAVQTADDKALTSAGLSFDVAGTPTRVALEALRGKLDDTTLSGKVEVADLARGALRFDLAIDTVDADRYLPPPAEGDAAPSPGAASAGAVRFDGLRALDAAGAAKIGALKVANLRLSDVAVTLKAKDGLVRLHPVSAKLYDGSYTGDITLDARGDVPAISVAEKVSGVQAGALLTDLQGVDRLTGRAAVSADLKTRGADPRAMKQALNGRVRFDFTDGAVKGFDINRMLREARAKLSGGSLPADAGPNQTDFSELGGTILVQDGRATNEDLSAKSPFLRVGGRGQAHLVQETIDYRITTSVVATAAGQGGRELADLAGVDIPIRITGTFSDPKYGLDLEALASALARSKVGEVVSGQTDALKGKAQDAISSKIGGVIGGAGSAGDAAPKGDGATTDKIGGALKGLLKRGD